MTSPTKPQLCKENTDMIILGEIDATLCHKLQTIFNALLGTNLAQLLADPTKCKVFFDSKSLIEELQKFLYVTKVEKIKAPLYQWQTDMIFHYNLLLNQIKCQSPTIIHKFLQHGFSVELMKLIPVSPRRSARLAQAKGSSPEKLNDGNAEFTHKRNIARNLLLEFNATAKPEPVIERITQSPRKSPRV